MSAIRYDRRVDPSFLEHFLDDGPLASLSSYAREALYPVDLQLRRQPGSTAQHATLYVGLTSVLDVRRASGGQLALAVHPSHAERARFEEVWRAPRAAGDMSLIWPAVEDYLDRVIPLATASHGLREGAVQAAVARHQHGDRVVLDRETTPSYTDRAHKDQCLEAYRGQLARALDDARIEWTNARPTLGTECDALAVDRQGRLQAIEVKPIGVGSVAFVAAQSAMYALMMKGWVDDDPSSDEVLRGMIDQRQRLGLAMEGRWTVPDRPRVVPVVAVQRGSSPEMVRRMRVVRDVIDEADLGIDPVEIFEVDVRGRMRPLEDSRARDGRPVSLRDYVTSTNARALEWKLTTTALTAGAKEPGRVPSRSGQPVEVGYALPREHAVENLLPEVRKRALELFASNSIAWHQGVGGGPTNHLRSSQVQCVNALGQMVDDPTRIAAAFGRRLDIQKVRDLGEVTPSEGGQFLTFEFTGEQDYFGEGKGGRLSRGAHCTSLDAAFAYRTTSGVDELALVEWKFTEVYPSPDRRAALKEAERLRRYESDLLDPDGPIKVDGISVSDLFHEPVYQLVRQQMLAWRMEEDPEVAATRVRVVHVLSPVNTGYTRSHLAPSLLALGGDVHEVWAALQRRPDRFVSLDPSVFLDPAITSDEYVARYAV